MGYAQNIIILLLFINLTFSSLLLKPESHNYYFKSQKKHYDGDKLILTPYIERGDIETARLLSTVHGEPFPSDVLSHSGLFTVNKRYNSNLFFWYFPAQNNFERKPLILWLQGGPGSPSVYNAVQDIGPFTLDKEMRLKRNRFSWHNFASLLFTDNPVGTGFSYTEDDAGYATNQTQIGKELYSALIQFFILFPELRENDFYIAGESYGGKYAASIGHEIYKNNGFTNFKINLKGLIISSGFVDPVSMLHYSKHVHELGLVDKSIRKLMKEAEKSARESISDGNMIDAYSNFSEALTIYQSSHMNIYNVLEYHYQDIKIDPFHFFLRTDVKKALHVGNIEFCKDSFTVYVMLIPEFMSSVKHEIETLLNNDVRFLFFNGQFDVICGYSLMLRFYESLNFVSSVEYKNAMRKPWFVGNHLAGYIKSAGNFTEVMVRNAGHVVPADQQKWVQNLVRHFTKHKR